MTFQCSKPFSTVDDGLQAPYKGFSPHSSLILTPPKKVANSGMDSLVVDDSYINIPDTEKKKNKQRPNNRGAWEVLER